MVETADLGMNTVVVVYFYFVVCFDQYVPSAGKKLARTNPQSSQGNGSIAWVDLTCASSASYL